MLDYLTTEKQITRLAGLPMFPDRPEAINELIKAMQLAPSVDKAARFITRWIADNAVAPTPAHIYAAFGDGDTTPEWKPPREGYECLACNDTGWIPILRNGKSGVMKCDCRAIRTGGRDNLE